jgi:hypothetical protein
VDVRRIPFERLVVLDVTSEQRIRLPRFEPAAIADALVRMVGGAAVAVVYRATSVGESQLMTRAEQRLRNQEQLDEAVAARRVPVEK